MGLAITEMKLMVLQVGKERTNKGLGLDLSHIVAEPGTRTQGCKPGPGLFTSSRCTGGGAHGWGEACPSLHRCSVHTD